MVTVVHPTSTTTSRTIRLVIELLRARRTAAFAARLRTPLAGALVLLMLAFPVSAGADDSASRIGRDSIGNGITLPWGLWVAGDATLHGQVPEHGPSLFEIDDMSLLAR